jgi:hypothetical protein
MNILAGGVDILGIPIPSRDPVFLGLVAVHVAFGLAAIWCGLAAMLSRKGRGRHSDFGIVYFWALASVFATASVLAFIRWAEDYVLFVLGSLAFACACLGRFAIRRCSPRWHLGLMAASYIVMLTAFYVDNGKNLPLWRDLPALAYWLVPSLVGAPTAAYYVFRLPKFALSPGKVSD